MADSVKVLRKQIAKRQVKVEEGTVVRFRSRSERTQINYWYGAIYVANRWWITSKADYFGKQNFTNEEFLDLVAAGRITDVDVATQFESIK